MVLGYGQTGENELKQKYYYYLHIFFLFEIESAVTRVRWADVNTCGKGHFVANGSDRPKFSGRLMAGDDVYCDWTRRSYTRYGVMLLKK